MGKSLHYTAIFFVRGDAGRGLARKVEALLGELQREVAFGLDEAAKKDGATVGCHQMHIDQMHLHNLFDDGARSQACHVLLGHFYQGDLKAIGEAVEDVRLAARAGYQPL